MCRTEVAESTAERPNEDIDGPSRQASREAIIVLQGGFESVSCFCSKTVTATIEELLVENSSGRVYCSLENEPRLEDLG